MKVTEAEEMIRVRLSMVMRQKRITPSILARKTGISESVIRGYVQEGVVPTAGRLAVICEALKLDIAWVCGLRAGRRIKMSDYDISMCNFNVTTFEPLLGKLLVKIEGAEEGSGEIRFVLDNGDIFCFYHEQDCCESVTVEDVGGNIEDLIGSPILLAEEVSSWGNDSWGSCTWTWYRFATVKGYVTIRWYGESNGYYSEKVDYRWIKKGEEK